MQLVLTTAGKADVATSTHYYTKDAEKMEVVSAQVIKKDGTVVPVTAKDIQDVQLGLELGVDYIALSFVREPSDIAGVHAIKPTATVLTAYLGNWDDVSAGKEQALAFIQRGADVIFQNADAAGQIGRAHV